MGQSLEPADVFTPTSPAIDTPTYTRRPAEEHVTHNALNERGTQILMFGDSTVGKTSFLLNELRHLRVPYLRIQCEYRMTWTKICEEILRILEVGVVKKATRKTTSTGGASVNLHLGRASGTLSREEIIEELRHGDSISVSHVAEVLARKGLYLIIDDFEKATNKLTRAAIANLAKNLSDTARTRLSARVVVIGISDNAHSLIESDVSIEGRLLPIEIPRMQDDEIAEILRRGFTALGINKRRSTVDQLTGNPTLNDQLASKLGGLPKYAHALGLEISRAAINRDSIIDDGTLLLGVQQFLARYTHLLRARYHKATVVGGERKSEYELLLNGLARLGIRGAFGIHEAMESIADYRNTHPQYATIQVAELALKRQLAQLSRDYRGSVIRKSDATGLYCYTDPLFPIMLLLSP